MTQNLSPMERDVRLAIIAPLGFIFAVSAGLTTAGGILMITCVVMTLISAFTGYSPFYELFHIDHAPAAA